jgi:hypothetical protein
VSGSKKRRRRQQRAILVVPPDVQMALGFVVSHLETIHAVATVAHDVLTRDQSERESDVARVIREGVMNALSVQMDVLREMSVDWQS